MVCSFENFHHLLRTLIIKKHIRLNDLNKLEEELHQHIWYSASGELEHFRRFWHENFNKKPSFKPNYILPNLTSIIRCMANENGLALVPDVLCQEEILKKEIQLLWSGKVKTENTLYFASRTDFKHKKESDILRHLFTSRLE